MPYTKYEILKCIGKQLQNCRKQSGYSRAAVANYMNITPRTLASYERGEREISIKTLIKITKLYKTNFYHLTDYKNVINKIQMEAL